MKTIYYDLETQSHCDLRRCGGHLYAGHPTTRIILLQAYFDGAVHSWTPLSQPRPDWLEEFNGNRVVAHNGFHFDHLFLPGLNLHPAELQDSMYTAFANGLRGGLGTAAATQFNLTESKDKVGHKVMMSLCKPIGGNLPWPNVMQMKALKKYCAVDVELCARLHSELPYPDEPELIQVDTQINRGGIRVDTKFAMRLLAQEQTDVAEAARIIADETGGLSARSIKLRDWLSSEGVVVSDLRSQTVERLLDDDDLPDAVKTVLRAKADASANTGSKLTRMIERSDGNEIIQGSLVYYGAHTGRWAGRGLQTHNFPRQKPPEGVSIDQLRAHDVWTRDERKALLRTCLLPSEGKKFMIVDFASVEARILAWMAGEQEILDQYAEDKDFYRVIAGKVFRCSPDEVTGQQRNIGKVLVLGCGYGLGGRMLGEYAKAYNIDLEALGLDGYDLVEQFRDQRPMIAGVRTGGMFHALDGARCGLPRMGGLWKDVDAAFRDAAFEQKSGRAGRCDFLPHGSQGVDVVLPSGRVLRYRRIQADGDGRKPQMTYSRSVGSSSKIYGGKLVENIDQAIGRDLLGTLLVRAYDMDLTVPLHVHDEPVIEIPIEWGQPEVAKAARDLLDSIPRWASGLPVAIEGFTAPWYTKAIPENTINISGKVLK